MRVTFYDLETTGLDYYEEDIIQVAIAVFDGLKLVKSEVLYFYYPEMRESAPDALDKHGMTKEWLKQYESVFRRNVHRMFVYLSGANVCGHNNIGFDDQFAAMWLERMWCPRVVFKSSIDTMQLAKPLVNKSRISLVKLCEFFALTPEKINEKAKEWFGQTGAAHNAFYDVTATALCYFAEQRMFKQLSEEDKTDPNLDVNDLIDLGFGPTIMTPERNKTYEEDCRFVNIGNGLYIPTCSDKIKYKSEPVSTLPENANVYPVVMEKLSDTVYTGFDGFFKHKLTITPQANEIELEEPEDV